MTTPPKQNPKALQSFGVFNLNLFGVDLKVNFTIDLSKLGELPMINLLILGIFSLLIVFVWRLPNILSEWRKFKSGDDSE